MEISLSRYIWQPILSCLLFLSAQENNVLSLEDPGMGAILQAPKQSFDSFKRSVPQCGFQCPDSQYLSACCCTFTATIPQDMASSVLPVEEIAARYCIYLPLQCVYSGITAFVKSIPHTDAGKKLPAYKTLSINVHWNLKSMYKYNKYFCPIAARQGVSIMPTHMGNICLYVTAGMSSSRSDIMSCWPSRAL